MCCDMCAGGWNADTRFQRLWFLNQAPGLTLWPDNPQNAGYSPGSKKFPDSFKAIYGTISIINSLVLPQVCALCARAVCFFVQHCRVCSCPVPSKQTVDWPRWVQRSFAATSVCLCQIYCVHLCIMTGSAVHHGLAICMGGGPPAWPCS